MIGSLVVVTGDMIVKMGEMFAMADYGVVAVVEARWSMM